MLSNRDRELAKEIAKEIRRGRSGGSTPPMEGMSAFKAWPGAAICLWIAYLLRDVSSLFWGISLFFAAGFIMSHSVWLKDQSLGYKDFGSMKIPLKDNLSVSKLEILFYFLIYFIGFYFLLDKLWSEYYFFVFALISLPALGTFGTMCIALFARRSDEFK